MGNFQTKIIDNRVIDLSYHLQTIKDDADISIHLTRYKDYLNTYGFYIININQSLLKQEIKMLFTQNDIDNVPAQYLNVLKYLNQDEIDKVDDDKLGELILPIFELASTFGFFSILEDVNIDKMSNIDKLTKMRIVVPKILFKKNNQEFFDFLTVHFIDKHSDKLPESVLNMLTYSLPNMLKGIFYSNKKRSNNNNIRFANILNILFNLSLALSTIILLSNNPNYKSEKMHRLTGKLLGKLSKYIKDDKCISSTFVTSEMTDDNNNLINVSPNVCNKKLPSKKTIAPLVPNPVLSPIPANRVLTPIPVCPECPVCPVCPTTNIVPVTNNITPSPSLITNISTTLSSLLTNVGPFVSKYRYYVLGLSIFVILIILYYIYKYMYNDNDEDTT
jgi:hypothetical protein